MRDFVIMTDSCCDMTAQMAEELGLYVLPLSLNMEGQIDFSTAPAYKNGDCYVVSYDWAQDTANIGEIMESVAKMLYPEEFTDLSGADKIVEFNKTNQK